MKLEYIYKPNLDPDGYLANAAAWDKSIAQLLAQSESIELNEQHWEIIEFLREFHQRYGESPRNMRALVTAIKKSLGEEKGSSMYLHILFPDNPLRQACRIAGLPKPLHCM